MTSEGLPDCVAALFEASNRRDTAGIMAVMTLDCIFENTNPPPDGERLSGHQAVRDFWERLFASTPQVRFDIEDAHFCGDRGFVSWRYAWVDAHGQRGHVRGVDVLRLRGNQISEKRSYVKG
jgi:ketosteroid isomerase-like protein